MHCVPSANGRQANHCSKLNDMLRLEPWSLQDLSIIDEADVRASSAAAIDTQPLSWTTNCVLSPLFARITSWVRILDDDAPARATHCVRNVVGLMEEANQTDAASANTPREQESSDRLEREHEQLFHELRSIIPGAEVLFAFLLSVAFSERFQRLTTAQEIAYFSTFITSASAVILLLSPAAFHRVRFRQRDKEAMMKSANLEAIVALVLISLSVAGTIFLITDLLYETWVAGVLGSIFWLGASALWWGHPLSRRYRQGGGDSSAAS